MSVVIGNIGLLFEMMETGSLYHVLHELSSDDPKYPADLFTKLRLCLDMG